MNTEDQALWATLCAPLDGVLPRPIRWNRLSSQARNALDTLFERLRPQLELLGMGSTWSRDDLLRSIGIERRTRLPRELSSSSGPRWRPWEHDVAAAG